MAFEHLETKLITAGNEDNINTYLDFANNLSGSFSYTFKNMLDIVSLMDYRGLNKEYKIVGGYAVLTHLVSTFGDKVIPNWRGSKGSSDIDLVGTEKVHSVLIKAYNIDLCDDRKSPNLAHKRTIKIRNSENHEFKECKVDLIIADSSEIISYSEESSILGVPLRVRDPITLIKDKVAVAHSQDNHKMDIMSLLATLEKRNVNSNDLVRALDHGHRTDLHELLISKERANRNQDGHGVPSEHYKHNLRSDLGRYVLKY